MIHLALHRGAPPPWRRGEIRIGRREVLMTSMGIGLGLATAGLILPEEAAAATEAGWRYCTKCRGLFAEAEKGKKRKKGKKPKKPVQGVCPAGGAHAVLQTHNYVLQHSTSIVDPNLIRNYFKCQKCCGLFGDDSGETGVCPAGGSHTGAGLDYEIWQGGTVPGMMDDAWDECSKCSGLFNWAGGALGICPAGGGHARLSSGTRYTLFLLI
jgi:hypothetical protein